MEKITHSSCGDIEKCSLWNSCKKLLTLLRWDWRVFAKSLCILILFLNKLNQYAHLKDTCPSLVQQIIVFSWSREAKYRSQEPQYLIGICSVNMSRLKSAKVFNPIPRLYITCRLSTYESHITVIFFQYSQVGDWSLILWNYNYWKKPQTGSRNLTGQKTLPTIWGTYMKLVTKYRISTINSCWEKSD
jgi:hypothetical protein